MFKINAELDAELHELESKAKELETKIEVVKARIVSEIATAGEDEGSGDYHKVKRVAEGSTKTVNWDALTTANPGWLETLISEFVKLGVRSAYFRFTKK